MIDFTAMSTLEIAEFIVAHQSEMGIANLTTQKVIDSLKSGKSVLETRHYGFAPVRIVRALTTSEAVNRQPQHLGRP